MFYRDHVLGIVFDYRARAEPNLAAFMTKLGAEDQVRGLVKGSLFNVQLLGSWAPGHWSSPARELAASSLGVLMVVGTWVNRGSEC